MIKLRAKPSFGNQTSFSGRRTKRRFRTNLVKVRFWSFVLSRFVLLRARAQFIKSLTKHGGLDFYILNCAKLPPQFEALRAQMLNVING
ncbi:MAG: bL28 family ribosomal protein [Candidatus Hodgkinia cicadicola]